MTTQNSFTVIQTAGAVRNQLNSSYVKLLKGLWSFLSNRRSRPLEKKHCSRVFWFFKHLSLYLERRQISAADISKTLRLTPKQSRQKKSKCVFLILGCTVPLRHALSIQRRTEPYKEPSPIPHLTVGPLDLFPIVLEYDIQGDYIYT